MPDFDVIVVGLGPVGAVLTGLLAQRGVCVAAFERSTSLYPLPRAIGFDHELMRVMQELRIADRVLRHTAAYRFHGLVAKSWRSGRFLLAGDSAHMTPPFMAQGTVQGIRDALNLAWKLARMIGGDSGPVLLDSYAQERIAHVKVTTATAIAFGRVVCERDLQRAKERDAQLRADHDGQIRTTFRQNIIPDIASGAIAADTAGAGSLLPQPSVQHDSADGQLLDDLTGSTVRLIVSAAITGSQLCDRTA